MSSLFGEGASGGLDKLKETWLSPDLLQLQNSFLAPDLPASLRL